MSPKPSLPGRSWVEGQAVTLYKFMEPQWADALVAGSSVRIGTLEDFRKSEMHQAGKTDPDEGTIKVKGRNSRLDIDIRNPLGKQLQKYGHNWTNSYIEDDGPVQMEVQIHNAYILSMARRSDPEVGLGIDPKYTCCVEIKDPLKMAQEITKSMQAKRVPLVNLSFRSVIYKERTIDETGELDASVFIKGPQFKLDEEYRYAWYAKTYEKHVIVPFDPRECGLSIVRR